MVRAALHLLLSRLLVPVMTSEERRSLRGLEIAFPLPQDGDELINFYAAYRAGPDAALRAQKNL